MNKKTIKIGIFGGYRGGNYYKNLMANNAEIVAVCDKNKEYTQKAKDALGAEVAIYSDFDHFIQHEGLEAVVLSNYFHEHAPYAIRALEMGIHVLSECTANGTMAEGVALVRAAEKSNAIYMLAENYPYMLFNQEMRRLYRSGALGNLIYAEGEYNHPLAPEDNLDYYISLCPSSMHWRYALPRTYYITHSLAPLMYITGAVPKRVTALSALDAVAEEPENFQRGVPERASIILTQNDDGSIFRVTGCSAFGHHESSYRICGKKGQAENLRDNSGSVLLSYNGWDTPESCPASRIYKPELTDKDKALIEKAGHGGGDFFVAREFLDCVREGRTPDFDVYFATTMASVAILAHRSTLEGGKPYDIPDLRKEEDRLLYENDTLSPFWGSDGTAPTIDVSVMPDYHTLTEAGRARYDALIKKHREKSKKIQP